jgi:hypothetical protein
MLFKKTIAVDKILQLRKRLRILQGSSSAGKTIAVLLIFSVVSETLPHT